MSARPRPEQMMRIEMFSRVFIRDERRRSSQNESIWVILLSNGPDHMFFIASSSSDARITLLFSSFLPSPFISFSAYRCCTRLLALHCCALRLCVERDEKFSGLLFISHRKGKRIWFQPRSMLLDSTAEHTFLLVFRLRLRHLPHWVEDNTNSILRIGEILVSLVSYVEQCRGSKGARRTWCFVRFQGRAICLFCAFYHIDTKTPTRSAITKRRNQM